MPLETYVARVLAGEALRDSQPAALEALAITMRTFALANRGRHRADGFDLCDQTHCQVLRAAIAATERAAQATAGRMLLRDGAPASVYYSASCGGRTRDAVECLAGRRGSAVSAVAGRRCVRRRAGVDRGAARAPICSARCTAAGFRGHRCERHGDRRRATRPAASRVLKLRRPARRITISGQDLRVAVGRTLGWQHDQEHGVRTAARRRRRTVSAATAPATASACA